MDQRRVATPMRRTRSATPPSASGRSFVTSVTNVINVTQHNESCVNWPKEQKKKFIDETAAWTDGLEKKDAEEARNRRKMSQPGPTRSVIVKKTRREPVQEERGETFYPSSSSKGTSPTPSIPVNMTTPENVFNYHGEELKTKRKIGIKEPGWD